MLGMTYLQRTLVNSIDEAIACGQEAARQVRNEQPDLAFAWARFAGTNARTALLILEHELTDDVTSDTVPS